jgi:putative aldouronate transport system substrate-binding protein
MKKKLFALLLLVVMLGALVIGCGKKTEKPKDNNTTDNQGTETPGTETPGKDEVVTLKWITVGNGMPTNYDAWQKHINAYLEKKIGVNIDVEVVPWGDWDNRRNVLINSGEYFDILFTDSGRYLSEVGLGAFYDMTDLVQEKAPDLYNYIPADYWNAVKVGGKIYSVPTYKDSSMTNYFVWDTAIADKYKVNIDEKHTLQSISDDLKKIKDGEGKTPFILDRNGLTAIFTLYDNMGAELPPLGVKVDDESRTVVNVLKEDQIMNDLKTLHAWYKEGIINADAPTLAELPKYRMCFVAQGWPSAAKTTWGPNMGAEAKAVEYLGPIMSNATVRGSLNAIYSGCKHPDKAMEFLQLVNMDPYVRDAFYYGLEGENFNYTVDKKVEKLNSEWNMAGYTQGTFFNVTQLAGEEINQWDEVKELNTRAKASVLLGFDLDQTEIQNELANCREIWNKYYSEVLTGARDPEEIVNTVTKELEAAGFNKIMEVAQKQIDAQFK